MTMIDGDGLKGAGGMYGPCVDLINEPLIDILLSCCDNCARMTGVD